MQRKFPIENYPAVIAYLLSLNPGDVFSTYTLIILIRGAETVDEKTHVSRSLNASIGRSTKAISEAYGFTEIKKKARYITAKGQKTCCSIWQMT